MEFIDFFFSKMIHHRKLKLVTSTVIYYSFKLVLLFIVVEENLNVFMLYLQAEYFTLMIMANKNDSETKNSTAKPKIVTAKNASQKTWPDASSKQTKKLVS